jgi:hypothetical protein
MNRNSFSEHKSFKGRQHEKNKASFPDFTPYCIIRFSFFSNGPLSRENRKAVDSRLHLIRHSLRNKFYSEQY